MADNPFSVQVPDIYQSLMAGGKGYDSGLAFQKDQATRAAGNAVGQGDFDTASQLLFKAGDMEGGLKLANLALQRKSLDLASDPSLFGGQQQQPSGQPSAQPTAIQRLMQPPQSDNGPLPGAPPPADPGRLNLTGPGKQILGVSVENVPPPQMAQNGGPQQPQQQFSPQAPQPQQNAQFETQATQLEQQAQANRRRAALIGSANPSAEKALLSNADALDAHAKQLREASQPTTNMKDAAASGPRMTPLTYEAKKEEQKNEITQSQKTYDGIQGQASQYENDLKPQLTILQSILNQPEMYSGFGGKLSLDFNKIRGIYGDQKAATLQQGLQKISAASMLSTVNMQKDQMAQAGGASSRIFSQQVEMVKNAGASIDNTVAGNRFVVNVQSRMGDVSSEMAQQARQYIQAHGHLDPGFDQQFSNYIKTHPVFTQAEQQNPALLGVPTVPPGASAPQASAWAAKMGLKPGDPVRLPSGRYVPVPGSQ